MQTLFPSRTQQMLPEHVEIRRERYLVEQRETERERERDRQTDRQTERQTERQTDRQTGQE